MARRLPVPAALRAAFAVVTAWLVLHEVHVLLAPRVDLGPLEARTVHLGVLLVAVLACAVAARRPGPDRLGWSLVALGMLSWALGEANYVLVLWDDAEPPIPSLSDAGFLLFPLILLPGLWRLARPRVGRLSPTVWADGVIVALAMIALSAAVLFPALHAHVVADPLRVAVVLAYPLTDVLMLVAIAVMLAAGGWRPDRRWALLAGGIVAFWLADSLYAAATVAGTYASGGWFDAGWWAGLLAIGAAAWQPSRPLPGPEGKAPREIAVPLAFGAIGLGLLVHAGLGSRNALAVVLAALSIVAVMVRLLLTFAEHADTLRRSRAEALTDPLTGLGNRRALGAALAGRRPGARAPEPLVLALFDLDGFKHYNDSYGHPAGDALLARLGAALAATVAGHGDAYRMGGDEFCVLIRPGATPAAPLLAAAVAALTEAGEDVPIGCSHGTVALPHETGDPDDALRIADRRMYADKQARRAAPGFQAVLGGSGTAPAPRPGTPAAGLRVAPR
jgi:diguanylate cyclase (GGDEF)-like protein